MSESKPVQKTPAWLLVADRYIAEIARAERLDALAAAGHARRTGCVRHAVLGSSRSSYLRGAGPTLIVQVRSRTRQRDLTASLALH